MSLSPDVRVEAEQLRVMAAELVHRGPDDDGLYVDSECRCGLSFRRLSIIDVAGGHQPIANEDETVWAVFNGEIYNYRELRSELESCGHVFRTNSDSETIVHAYEEYGEECFGRFSGMFAIAIWDARSGRLTLARDRFGKKPLTYAIFGDRLYFASEAKAIVALPNAPREINPQSLHRYLLFQYVAAPHSIYRGYRKMQPGRYVTIQDGQASRPTPFWRLPRPTAFTGTYADAKQRLGELLKQAVEKRLIADVPLGAFLSGGLDSSIVVGLMQKLGVSPLRTFSIGFPDARYDETAYAREVARHFGTEHHEHVVTPQAREILDTLAWHYDEPFADSSAIPTYYVSRYTRESVSVALTGDAGDECFAGYDRYTAARMAARFDAAPRMLRRMAASGASILPHSTAKSFTNRLYRFLSALGLSPSRRYLSWINIFTPTMLVEGYRPEFAEQIDFEEPLGWFDDIYRQAPGGAAEQANFTDFQSYLPYDLLTKVDIASMACGLECRSPFLDHELVEFALSLPFEWRLGSTGGKHILKDWASEFLPPTVIHRPKMGFGVPVGEWFRNELRDLLEGRLCSPDALVGQIFKNDWLHAVVNSHISGRTNHEHPLWALLMLELWASRWLQKTA